MQFNQNALKAKMSHLDEIKRFPGIIDEVLKRNIRSDYEIVEKNRIWVGGGSTSYVVETHYGKLFLKIKHKDVTVESKLEEEHDFINESCIKHECRMMKLASKAGVSVPRVVFYDEQANFQFLATEFVEDSLEDALKKASLEETLIIWKDLYRNVELMYEAGLVHSDIHEFNIRCNKRKVFLIDLEETRELVQNCGFEKSLDYVGKNEQSSLGEFPLSGEQTYTVKTNCLKRMRQVFKKNIVPKVIEFVKKCNYDSTNGICTALDHGCSMDTYQSINSNWITVKGQREQKDIRPILILKLFKALSVDCSYTFVDVGSNNGLFCREISKGTFGVMHTIGLEGFHTFNILAKSLAFLEDCDNTEYHDFICGEDDIDILNIESKCFFSICSVWHHIQNKSKFLMQLNSLDARYVFLEMPVQSECYDGRSWGEEISAIKEELVFEDCVMLGYSRDYNRPLVLLSKYFLTKREKHKVKAISKHILKHSRWHRAFDLLTRGLGKTR